MGFIAGFSGDECGGGGELLGSGGFFAIEFEWLGLFDGCVPVEVVLVF